jgi:outer membrane protein insertion porin family
LHGEGACDSIYRILPIAYKENIVNRSIGLILLILFIATSLNAQKVDRVDVKGNLNVSAEKIMSIIGIKPGSELKGEKVSQGIKRLFKTKNFSDIAVYYRKENGENVIVVKVEEYPLVESVKIVGVDKLDDEDVREKVTLREGFFARPSMITSDKTEIKKLYLGEGYNNTQVELERKRTKEGSVAIVYKVKEGEKISIRHIDFIGNGAIDSDRLRDIMTSREDRWWRGGEFNPDTLQMDLGKIEQLYADKGYLEANASVYRKVETEDGEHLDIYIKINEGHMYYVGDISWSGNEVIEDKVIEDIIPLEEGDVFSLIDVEMTQYQLRSLYWEKGYIYSRVIPQQRVKRRKIDMHLNIVENEPAHINEIKIGGNTKTFETVIRRELEVFPGDRFVLKEVQRSLREVFQLGYFQGPPRIDTEKVNEEGDINLLIDVKEKQTGNFKMGAGFSQLNSLSGFLGISENNFLGRGKSISLDWEFGRYRKNLQLQYVEPHLFGSETMMSASIFNWIQNRVQQQYYTDRRKGFSFRFGHPMPWLDYSTALARYRLESVELSDFSSNYPVTGVLYDMDWPMIKSSVTLTFRRNSTDSPFHPTRGSVSELSAEFSGGILGGNVGFQRYTAEMSWFRNFLWKFTFHLKANAGIIDPFGKDPLEDFEKYRLGGNRMFALRGYDYYEVVPEGNDPYVGGRFMTTLVQEIVFPLSNQVYCLLFFDAGNTWNSFGEADIFKLKRGLGIGIRIEMPGMGNLGFDYGYGVDKVGGAAWEPHFTFGSFF